MAAPRKPSLRNTRDTIQKPNSDPNSNSNCVVNGFIAVAIANAPPNNAYNATVSEFQASAGTIGSGFGTVSLTETPPGSGTYCGNAPAGIIVSNPPLGTRNRAITILNVTSGTIEGTTFRAINCGSGSSGSGVVGMRLPCKNCKPGHPVPEVLHLKLDGHLKPGTCGNAEGLNHPIALRHVDGCTWISDPIALGSRDRAVGVWTLERTSPKTWKLTLRRGKSKLLATYAAMGKNKDCSLPATLPRKGEGKAEFVDWPETATLTPG